MKRSKPVLAQAAGATGAGRPWGAARTLATGATVYALGVILSCVAVGLRPHPLSENAVNPASAPAITAQVQPQSADSNLARPLLLSNAPPPREALVSALQKADSAFGVNHFVLHDELGDLLVKLGAEDFPPLWQALKELKSEPVRTFIGYDFFGAWGRVDPRGALAAAQTLSNSQQRDSAESAILWTWSSADVNGALAWVRRIQEPGQREWALVSIVQRLAERDPERAARLLGEIGSVPVRDRAASAVVGGWATRDPAAATALAQQIRSRTDRDLAFSDIADTLLVADVGQALAWAQALPITHDRTTALYKVLAEITRRTPERALELLMAQPEASRNELACEVAYTWASQELQAAAQWACGLPAGEMQANAVSYLVRACPVEELRSAAEALVSLADGALRSRALNELGKRWQQALLLDAPGALEVAAQFPAGADRDGFLAGVCAQLNLTYAEEAARLAQHMVTQDVQARAGESAASNWSRGDPEAAAAWAGALPAGKLRDRALAAVSKQWGTMEPEAANEWLRSLPADAARGRAVAAFIGSVLTTRPDLGAAWVAAVPDETQRARWLERVSRQWLQKEPEAARAWLATYRAGQVPKN